LRTAWVVFAATIIVLPLMPGCNNAAAERQLLTVDFHQAEVLRYRFVSSRDIEVNWGPPRRSRSGKLRDKIDKSFESMDMVVAYTPLEVDPYGLSTIKATCEKVKVKRSPRKSRRGPVTEPAEAFSGKSFTFTVDARGKIYDYSQLDQLIRQIGAKAFRPNSRTGRVKDPDMISDFIATQYFLWDSVSSIKQAAEGVATGQSWTSKLSVPNPMVLRKARDVTYTLDEIRDTQKGRVAVIRSSYSPSESVPKSWPNPYPAGTLRLSGVFGFLGRYRLLSLQGKAEELFNIDTGQTQQLNQQYQMQLEASLQLPMAKKPVVTIKQNLQMQLLE